MTMLDNIMKRILERETPLITIPSAARITLLNPEKKLRIIPESERIHRKIQGCWADMEASRLSSEAVALARQASMYKYSHPYLAMQFESQSGYSASKAWSKTCEAIGLKARAMDYFEEI